MSSIRKQLEFYFSESNLRKDKFLRDAIKKDSEGWVPISVLITFNKLKKLSTDVEEIAAAVKDSEEISVSEDGSKLKRVCDIPVEDTSKERTLYAKGYPIDDPDVTIESVSAQFAEHGEVLMTRLRKDPRTKGFKGSAFIEFKDAASVASAVKACNNEDKTVSLQWKDTPLLCVMELTDWLTRKEAKRVKRKEGKKRGTSGDDLEENGGKKAKIAADEDASSSAKKDEPLEYTKGLIIKVDDVPSGTSLYEIKDCFKAIGEVKFVEFSEGSSTAWIRVADIASSVAVVTALEKGLKITPEHTTNVNGTILSGDDEHAYWVKLVAENAKKQAANKGGRHGKGSRGGRGGPGGRGGRGGRR